MIINVFIKSSFLIFVLVGGITHTLFAHADDVLYVVGHSSHSAKTLSKQEIQNIFLGRIRSFPNGQAVTPMNLRKGSEGRRIFMEKILKINEFTWRSNWVRLLFTGKGKPPKELQNAQAVIDYVSQKKSALAYFIGPEQDFEDITVFNVVYLGD